MGLCQSGAAQFSTLESRGIRSSRDLWIGYGLHLYLHHLLLKS